MQSNLAVIQFPLAAVPSVTPDASPTSHDFAISFAEEPLAIEGEVAPADPTLTASDLSVVWVAPIIPAHSGFSAGLQDLAVATGTQNTLADTVDAATPPDEGQASTLASAAGPVAVEDLSNAIDFGSNVSKAETAAIGSIEGLLAPGKVPEDATQRPVSLPSTGRPEVQPQEIQPKVAVPTELPGPRAQGQAAAEPAPAREPQHDKPATTTPVQVTIATPAAGPDRPADEAPPQEAPPQPSEPGNRLIQALPVDLEPPANVSPALADATASAQSAEVETALPREVEAAKPDKRPDTETIVVSASAVATTLVTKPSASAIPVSGSFWERYFTNRSDPQPASVPSQDPQIRTSVEQVLSAIGIKPRLVVTKDESIAVPPPEGELSESDAEVADTATIKAAAATGPGALPALEAAADPAVVLNVQPWSEGIPNRVERFDSPLSSLSGLASVSTSGVATGSAGPLSLPVQQVATLLASVLVQASDRATELALAPEELGKVRLRLEPDASNPDRLMITINVERPETLDLFRRHAGELAEAIRAAGYSGADIDFGAHGQGDNGKGQPSGTSAGPDQASDETAPIQYSPRINAGSTLDLRL